MSSSVWQFFRLGYYFFCALFEYDQLQNFTQPLMLAGWVAETKPNLQNPGTMIDA